MNTLLMSMQVKISLAAVYGFMAIAFPTIIYYTGIAGFFKFWLMPWLGYHFWMSTFTVVHHTAPHIPFRAAEDWSAAEAQLAGTVHCDFPRWSASQSPPRPHPLDFACAL